MNGMAYPEPYIQYALPTGISDMKIESLSDEEHGEESHYTILPMDFSDY